LPTPFASGRNGHVAAMVDGSYQDAEIKYLSSRFLAANSVGAMSQVCFDEHSAFAKAAAASEGGTVLRHSRYFFRVVVSNGLRIPKHSLPFHADLLHREPPVRQICVLTDERQRAISIFSLCVVPTLRKNKVNLKNIFVLLVVSLATMAQGQTTSMAPEALVKKVTNKCPANSNVHLRQAKQLPARKWT
jgi:hypothetical protein